MTSTLPRVIILVLSSNQPLYRAFKRTWLRIQEWCVEKELPVRIFHHYGLQRDGADLCYLSEDGHDLMCNVRDGHTNGGVVNKTYIAMDYCYKNFEFDYLVTTNLSSILLIDRLLETLKDCPREKFLSGHIIRVAREDVLNFGLHTVSRDICQVVSEKEPWKETIKGVPGPIMNRFMTENGFEKNATLSDRTIFYEKNKPPEKGFSNTHLNLNAPYRIDGEYNDSKHLWVMKNNPHVLWIRVKHPNPRERDLRIHQHYIDEYFV